MLTPSPERDTVVPMTTLRDIFDYDAFLAQVQAGFIAVKQHPTANLSIANYTPAAQYNDMRTPEVESSRGLIFKTDTLEVVARGFRRFYNWDDSGQPYPPHGPMILSTKFDGSLGILYADPVDGSLAIATRGSFASDQSLHATEHLREVLFIDSMDDHIGGVPIRREFDYLLERGFTPVFEIIYPQNRIVVDYQGADRLVLLDVIHNRTGFSNFDEFDALSWPDKADKRLLPGFSDSITHDIPRGEEGFVLYWPGSGFRCKMKSAEYVELHRIVTGLSKKSVWEMLGQGKTVSDIKENVPDELFAWVDETVAEFNDATAAIVDQAYADYDAIKNIDPWLVSDDRNRGRFAREAQNFPATRAYLFMILDGKQPEDLWKAAWKTVKPTGDTRVWNKTEDVA